MLELVLNQLSPKTLIIAFVSVLLIRNVVSRIITDRRIRALGGYAPSIRAYLPGSK